MPAVLAGVLALVALAACGAADEPVQEAEASNAVIEPDTAQLEVIARSEIRADLRAARVAQEIVWTAERTYASSVEELVAVLPADGAAPFPKPGVELDVVRASDDSYCIEGRHEELDEVHRIVDSGEPESGSC